MDHGRRPENSRGTGIDGLTKSIFKFMNANEISPKANVRMARIQKTSKYLRLVLQYGILFYIFSGLLLSLLAEHGIIPSIFIIHAPAAQFVRNDFVIFPIYSCLLLIGFLFWYRTVVRLFGFFEQGVLFTAETVRCIQILGGIYFAKFFLQMVFHFSVTNPVWINSKFNDLFIGFFIFFIGWLMNEARKIREEQELTI
ncbi:MAG TPA: DUF2975 domain-containing protein [Verrucomicrobiae bacterium]|nr:DUF2975 domain-containing protein [Verrucomicrobiae bacterium]